MARWCRCWAVLASLWFFLYAAGAWGAHHQGSAAPGFSDVERALRLFEDPQRETWQQPEKVIAALRLRPGDVVADIGAGTGYFARRLAAAVGPQGKVLALDIEPALVAYMQEDARRRGLPNYEARQVAPHDPGLAPGSVDVVFLCNTYHHLEKRVAYFRALRQALKPGGRVVIIDFYQRPLPLGPPPQVKVAQQTVVAEMQQAGYRLHQAHGFLPYQYFLEFVPRAVESER
ncbi:MAG: hypothetical protein KatS3mg131_3391 [Candidatus Tectimicrobiota bacterium]|nr:MAG: hypothetical protein KatS3mg131_3391 [Candidatus Tectomicrobia bacterium]